MRLQQKIDDNMVVVKPSDGGGSRFINISREEDPLFEEIMKKGLNMYFPGMKDTPDVSLFDYNQKELNVNEKVRDYLLERGLYASRTWFFLTTGVQSIQERTFAEPLDKAKPESEEDEFPQPLKRRRKVPSPKVECPICYQKFERDIIESHAGSCKLPVDVNSDEESQFSDVEEPDNETEQIDKEPMSDRVEAIIETQKLAPVQLFRVIRHKCWQKYIDHVEKKWFKINSTLEVTFIGENAVGDGPRREFFQGKVIYFLNKT